MAHAGPKHGTTAIPHTPHAPPTPSTPPSTARLARVGRVDAVDVGPDHDLGGGQQRAHDRRAVVAAVAAQGGHRAVGGAGDEAGDDQDGGDGGLGGGGRAGVSPLRTGRRPRVEGGGAQLVLHVDARPVGGGDDDQGVPGVHHVGVVAVRAQAGAQQARAPQLAVPHDKVRKGVGRGPRDADGGQHGLEVDDVSVQGGDKGVPLRPGPQQRVGRVDMLGAQRLQVPPVPGVPGGGAGDHIEEEVGHLGREAGRWREGWRAFLGGQAARDCARRPPPTLAAPPTAPALTPPPPFRSPSPNSACLDGRRRVGPHG